MPLVRGCCVVVVWGFSSILSLWFITFSSSSLSFPFRLPVSLAIASSLRETYVILCQLTGHCINEKA